MSLPYTHSRAQLLRADWRYYYTTGHSVRAKHHQRTPPLSEEEVASTYSFTACLGRIQLQGERDNCIEHQSSISQALKRCTHTYLAYGPWNRHRISSVDEYLGYSIRVPFTPIPIIFLRTTWQSIILGSFKITRTVLKGVTLPVLLSMFPANVTFSKSSTQLITVFTAEMCAISHALTWVRTRRHRNILILSDCLSALVSLCQFRNSRHYIVDEIVQELDKLKVANFILSTLLWIAGHLGIQSNELTGRLAKAATADDSDDFSGIPGVFQTVIHETSYKQIHQCWDHQISYYKSLRYFQSRDPALSPILG